MVPLD